MEDFIGKEIGGCKIESKLGQGGMGAVYKGTQLSLGREVAVKVISEAYMANEQAVARFEREARSVAQLNHANIVQVYDLGRTEEGQYYISMEFIDGRSLSEILKTEGALPERQCLTMIRQAAKGLQVAAEKNIIHRDIKPDNLMVTVKGVVKVADFGLAKDVGSASQLTATGHVMGTPAYIAPEQGDGRVSDHRSDLYSLGATLFAMLTGDMPYVGETPIAIVLQHIQAPIPNPQEKNPDLSDETCKIVRKMMAKEPEERYQNAGELIHDIDVVLGVAKDGERLIADGGDVPFDDTPTFQGSLMLEKGVDPQETRMEVASPTPQTIDAGRLRSPSGRELAPARSRTGLFAAIGGGVVIVALAVVLGIVFLGNKGDKEPTIPPKTGPEADSKTPGVKGPSETKGTEKKSPVETKGPEEKKGETPDVPTPPRPAINIMITMPGTGSYHMQDSLMVRGKCTGPEAKTVTVNGTAAALSFGGNFRTTIKLNEGAQDIRVVAEGEGNAFGEAIIAVVVDMTKPVLAFKDMSPDEDIRIRQAPFQVEGTVDDLSPTKVSIQGLSATVEGEKFKKSVPLFREGKSRIQVSAEDKAGNETSAVLTVIYDPNPPRINLVEVPKKLEQADPRILLQGSIDEEDALASLKLGEKDVPLDGSSFSMEVELQEGENRFALVAKDLAGNESTVTVEVEFKILIAGLTPTEEEGVYLFEKDGATMTPVPREGVTIGADDGNPDEGPAHKVVLSPYYMDKTEVTNAQYKKFLEALAQAEDAKAFSHPDQPPGKDHTPEYWDDPEFNKPDQPVVGVDWFDAWAYAKWAGKSLPTEAEWEAAARAGFLDKKPLY
ncbi:MAG: protein kinase domain-containing protein, partial [Planctomycetota bacterium]